MEKICLICGTEFHRRGRAYAWWGKAKYCSDICKAVGMRGDGNGSHKRRKSKFCICGKEIQPPKKRNRSQYCSRKCLNSTRSPIGKQYKIARGYIKIKMADGKTRLEHVVLMENVLGRRLNVGEVIHHINGIKDDNRLENLRLMTNSEHRKLHHEMSRLYALEHFGGPDFNPMRMVSSC